MTVTPGTQRWTPRRASTAIALVGALLGFGTVALPATAAAQPAVTTDSFFDAPADLAALAPGAVIRTRTVPVAIYGFSVPAQQLVYRSADTAGRPLAAVTTVVEPTGPSAGPRPLVSYQAAINSLDPECSPSRLLPAGELQEQFMVAFLLLHGWSVALPDHEGPAAAYSAGRLAAQVTLDGIRAVQSFPDAGTGGPGSPVALWGYSGGGLATAWAAELAPRYAPELNIVGSAEGGVPVDANDLIARNQGGPAFGLLFAAAVGLSREFPEIQLDEQLNDRGRALATTLSGSCVGPTIDAGSGLTFDQLTTTPGAVRAAGVQAAITANTLGQAVPRTPVLLYHSVADNLVPTAGADRLAAEYCAGGATVDYYHEPQTDHVAAAVYSIPIVLTFLEDRFAGRPAQRTC